MRVIVLFDLPVRTSAQIKEYTKFRKFLLRDGFLMMQESVYIKLVLNSTVAKAQIKRVHVNKPSAGLVQLLTITEKQFSRIEYIVGEKKTTVVDSDTRLVVL